MSKIFGPFTLEDLKDLIAEALEIHIRPLLPDIGDFKLTLIGRVEGNPEADVIVTQDSGSAVMTTAYRRLVYGRDATQHHPECPCSFSEAHFCCNCPPGWGE